MTEELILKSIVGKTIKGIGYNGSNSAPITIVFTDDTAITIDAIGDDMSHTTIEQDITPVINIE